MHLGLEGGDHHLVIQRPDAHGVGLGQGLARRLEARAGFAQQQFGEQLALVDRELAARLEAARRGAPGALGRVHAAGFGHRALEHPLGQRLLAERVAGVDVFLHHLRHLEPAGFLPQLERALLHAEAPAHGQVHVARGLGDVLQVHGGVVEAVAQDGPEEPALRPFGIAQQLQALGGRALEHAAVHLVGLLAGGHVLARLEIEAQDVAAHLLVEAGAGLLAQVLQLQQLGQHRGRAVAAVERIGLVAQVVLQRLDDVAHRVQAHHVDGAEGAAAGAAQALAGEVVDHVEGQAELLDLLQRAQHAGDADTVGHEVGRVLGAHHALAQAGGDEGFQLVEHHRLGGGRADQLHQDHVARRVEEVDAAEARAQRLGQRLAQLRDRQAGGVAGQDGVLADEGRDLVVQVALPVHALGDGLDHQVAALELLQVVLVVGRLDQRGVIRHRQRRRLELLQVVDGLEDDAVLGAFLGRQVEQDDRDLAVDQVRRDLRPHHARAEHGDFSHIESGHVVFLEMPAHRAQRRGLRQRVHLTRIHVCVRQKGPMEPRTWSLWPPSTGVSRSA